MEERICEVQASEVRPGANDRTRFDEVALQALAANIATNGLIQRIVVRPIMDGSFRYEIVAGERRARACRLLGWATLPVSVRELDDRQASVLMLTENLARKDLNPIDEARAYQVRMDRYGMTVEDLAQAAGVSKIHVQFRLKLLGLAPELQHLVSTGHLSMGYAQVIADSGVDSNRQIIAIRRLDANASPTPAWLRRECGILFEEQAQEPMFELLASVAEVAAASAPQAPPLPGTDVPPVVAGTPKEVVTAQAGFWGLAAEQWEALGRPFKRQECLAAVAALRSLEAAI